MEMQNPKFMYKYRDQDRERDEYLCFGRGRDRKGREEGASTWIGERRGLRKLRRRGGFLRLGLGFLPRRHPRPSSLLLPALEIPLGAGVGIASMDLGHLEAVASYCSSAFSEEEEEEVEVEEKESCRGKWKQKKRGGNEENSRAEGFLCLTSRASSPPQLEIGWFGFGSGRLNTCWFDA